MRKLGKYGIHGPIQTLAIAICILATVLLGPARGAPATPTRNQSDAVGPRYERTDRTPGGPGMETIQNELRAKWSAIQSAEAQNAEARKAPLEVRLMPEVHTSPGSGVLAPSSWVGRDNIFWGTLEGGVGELFTLMWDFGDGTLDGHSTAFAPDFRYLPWHHTYTAPGVYTVRFTVINHLLSGDTTDFAEMQVEVVDALGSLAPEDAIYVQVQAAIEDGLRYLYLSQDTTGHWNLSAFSESEGDGLVAWAFHARGHDRSQSADESVYGPMLDLYWQAIFSELVRQPLGLEPAGDPDANANGYGLTSQTAYDVYGHGILMTAMGTMNDLSQLVTVGTEAGRTVLEVLQDLADQLAFCQTDTGIGRGGWRYDITNNDFSADNSIVQWAAQALLVAGVRGVVVPQFVKDELELWTLYSQDGPGGFGYTLVDQWNNLAKTGSGMLQLRWLGYSSASAQAQDALDFSGNNWASLEDGLFTPEQFNGNLYAMLAMKKGLNALGAAGTIVSGHEWQDEYNKTLVSDPTNTYDGTGGIVFANDFMEQRRDANDYVDGRWQDQYWLITDDNSLETAAAVLILEDPILPSASICGIKYWDQNRNGTQDLFEQGVPDWVFTATDENGQQVGIETTDQDGHYCFILPAGSYEIAEQFEYGWVPIEPTAGTQAVVVGLGENLTGVDFGNLICPDFVAKLATPYCAASIMTSICRDADQATVNLIVCNSDIVPHEYAWSVSPVEPGTFGCTASGVTEFSEIAGRVTVAPGPGSCAKIPVTVTAPSDLDVGETSCFFLNVINLDTGECCQFLHHLRRTTLWCDSGPIDRPPVTGMFVGVATQMEFELVHEELGPQPLDYSVVALGPDGLTVSTTIALDGLAPGDSTGGFMMVAPQDTARITVNVEFTQHELGAISQLVLLVDDDGDGQKEALVALPIQSLAATGVEPSLSPTILGLRAAPNPFGASTDLRLSLARKEEVSVQVYNLAGRLVRTVYQGELPAGGHVIHWDGRDRDGRTVSSGVYMVRAIVSGADVTTRVLRLR